MPRLIDYLNARAQNDREAQKQLADANTVIDILMGEEVPYDDDEEESEGTAEND